MENKSNKRNKKEIDAVDEKIIEIKKILKERGPDSQVGVSELKIKGDDVEKKLIERIKKSDDLCYYDTKRIIKKIK